MCLPLGWPPPPLLPVLLSLQYGSPVWEAAIPSAIVARRSRGRWHRSARPTLWKRPAPALCDTWHPVGLCRSGRSSSFLPGPSAQRSAADRRHLVCACACACAAGPPASAALAPNNRPQLQTSGFLLLLLAVTDPTLAS